MSDKELSEAIEGACRRAQQDRKISHKNINFIRTIAKEKWEEIVNYCPFHVGSIFEEWASLDTCAIWEAINEKLIEDDRKEFCPIFDDDDGIIGTDTSCVEVSIDREIFNRYCYVFQKWAENQDNVVII